MKKIFYLLLFLTFTNTVFAGVRGLTFHSRANCINNESIAWDLRSAWKMKSESNHFKKNEKGSWVYDHKVKTEYELTHRSASVDWFEGGIGGDTWVVTGYF